MISQKKIKILQINTVVNSGSIGRIAEGIGQLAIHNGSESYIAYGRNERPSQSKLIKIGSVLDVSVHVLQTRFFDRHGLGSSRSTQRFIKQIEEIKPDIIHLHNIHGYYLNINIFFKYLEKADIPVVWTLHDCWPITGHCTNFESANCQKWKMLCSDCPQTKSYPASLFVDRSEKNYLLKKEIFTSIRRMVIVPVSEWLRRILSESFLSQYPIQIINTGIDTNMFKPVSADRFREKYKIKEKFIILGVASAWIPSKGFLDFIKLSKKLDSSSVIVLIGVTNSQIKTLPSNMIGILRTENVRELAEAYSAANVFLNPTYEDNFPTTNLEALACGVPVVTYKTGGSVESVSSETGFTVEKGDIVGLFKIINIIQKNEKVQYSEKCIERVKKLYDKNDRYSDYLNLYHKLIY